MQRVIAAVQAAAGLHEAGAHAMEAMLWSMGLLIAAPVVLVAIGAIWYRRSQRIKSRAAGTPSEPALQPGRKGERLRQRKSEPT